MQNNWGSSKYVTYCKQHILNDAQEKLSKRKGTKMKNYYEQKAPKKIENITKKNF